jgi:hypothetical protein
LGEHFDLHGEEFGAENEDQYELLAAQFMLAEPGQNVLECRRAGDQARIRYDFVTQECGIVSADNFILTYFKPDPRWHGRSTNRAYFESECRRRL